MPFFTAILVVGLTEANSVMSGKGFKMTPVIGGFLLGGFLFVLQDANPAFTSKLSTLIILTALIYNGNGVFKAITPKAVTLNKVTKKPTKKLV